MRDYSRFPAPREAQTGRRLQIEERRRENRGLMYGLLGLAGMCICIGLAALVFMVPLFNGHPLIEIGASAAAPAATPTRSSATRPGATATTAPRATEKPGSSPTAVPQGRSVTASNGLKVTVTSSQRPLPAEGITIPDGQELALVSVRVENTRASGTALKVKPQDFQLVSPNNEAFNPNVGGITTGEMLAATDVEPGKIIEGDMIFYVYSDIQDLSLAWKSSDGTRLFSLQRAR